MCFNICLLTQITILSQQLGFDQLGVLDLLIVLFVLLVALDVLTFTLSII
jgi:hypothetical protein